MSQYEKQTKLNSRKKSIQLKREDNFLGKI